MATQTSNLGLTKPAYSETADIADINNNMDKVDAAVNGVQNGMAILANGNVHSAVTSGQYVYVRNHGTLAEGLYTATTNIFTNATLSTSNLTAVPNNGALNTLRDDVTSLNSNLENKAFLVTIPSNTDLNNIVTNGLYRSPSTVSEVSTLTNCPTTVPFTMLHTGIDNSTVGRVQTIFTDGSIYVRRATSSGYGRWYKFTGEAV